MVYETILNETVNATINHTVNATVNLTAAQPGFFADGGLASLIWERTIDLIKAPAANPEMFWIVTPLVIITILMEFYFGRYKDEEIGWNTAVSNSLLLVFISIDLLRYLHSHPPVEELFSLFGIHVYQKTIMVAVLAFVGFFLFFIDFFHFFPKKAAFLISSGLFTHLLCYVGIVLIYSEAIPLDAITFIASIVLFLILALIFQFVHFVEPKVDEG